MNSLNIRISSSIRHPTLAPIPTFSIVDIYEREPATNSAISTSINNDVFVTIPSHITPLFATLFLRAILYPSQISIGKAIMNHTNPKSAMIGKP